MCMLMSACADNGDTQLPEISVITKEEMTDIITESSAALQTEAVETKNSIEENTSETETDMTEELTAEASRLSSLFVIIVRLV